MLFLLKNILLRVVKYHAILFILVFVVWSNKIDIHDTVFLQLKFYWRQNRGFLYWQRLTLKSRETHEGVLSTVATDALVLKHQTISIHSAD